MFPATASFWSEIGGFPTKVSFSHDGSSSERASRSQDDFKIIFRTLSMCTKLVIDAYEPTVCVRFRVVKVEFEVWFRIKSGDFAGSGRP